MVYVHATQDELMRTCRIDPRFTGHLVFMPSGTLRETPHELLDFFLDAKDAFFAQAISIPARDRFLFGKAMLEAIVNGARWGNEDVPGRRVTLTMQHGYNGDIVSIEDQGTGFDYASRISAITEGRDHEYRHRGGGMRRFHEIPQHVSYHGCGNVLSIVALDEPPA